MLTVDLEKLHIQPGDTLLDVGCGSGRHLASSCRVAGIRAVGVDLSRTALAEAEERLRYHYELGYGRRSQWLLAAGDVTRPPFRRRSFRHIICSEVLEHLMDDRAALRELVELLRPGGNLVISVPRFYPEWICWALSRRYRQSDGGHVRIYRRRQLVERCRGLKLHLWHHHYAHSLHVPYWWMKCMEGMGPEEGRVVKCYHRLLVWDMMQRPEWTQWLDRLLNPVAGKSLVLYFTKSKR